MNSTKVVRGLLALSLAANLALGWMLWQQRHPEQTEKLTISAPASPTKAFAKETTPVSVVESPIARAPRIEPPLPPPTRGGINTTKAEGLLFSSPGMQSKVDPSKVPAYLRLERPESRAYGPPPPPNPHAVPPWDERLPYREDQMKRGLYSTPLKLDK
ncbi:MAG TPA: hypothetical protein VLE43_09935 [Candidatus Saccharimonadia bacterium]|nr:hypothetical protein [Candidatus Saccharimonadia bacterium]